mgnify:FL=1
MTKRHPAPPIYIWVVDGEPETGTLRNYADDWMRWRGGICSRPSKTVLTWDDISDPITWDVVVTPGTRLGGERRRYRIAVSGFPDEVHVTVNDPDETEGTP